MKALKFLFGTCCTIFLLSSCSKDIFNDTSFIDGAAVSSKLAALYDITQDNTGLVTITPMGEAVGSFDITYGDATTTVVTLLPGKNTTHTYAEGVYKVKIVGHNINGKTTEVTQDLTVSFRAPENLKVTLAQTGLNLNVSASALYETFFKVYFGDSSTANPVPFKSFIEGQTVTHDYPKAGTYIVKVIALSGGVATTQRSDTIKVGKQINLPVGFDDPNFDYTMSDFGGASSSFAVDPKSSMNNVMKVVKTAGAEVWAGTTVGTGLGFSSPIPIKNGSTRMSVKVYSPAAGLDVKLKIEDRKDGSRSVEADVFTTKANAWETLVFDFVNQTPGTPALNLAYTFDKASLFFDFGTAGSGKTFYFDDLQIALPPLTQIKLPVTFDDATVDYTVTDFGNNLTVDAIDPKNAANNVKKTTKQAGAETWAGTTIGTAKGFAAPIAISSNATKMSVSVYSPAAGLSIKLKIEDRNDGSHSVETDALTTKANTWETLVFDFSNPSANTPGINSAFVYDKASIFFDFGVSGSGKVFYFDDVKLMAATLAQINLPITFDEASVDYTAIDFGNNATTDAVDPTNSSNKVKKTIKTNGAETWAGTTMSTSKGFATAIPITSSATKMSVSVYSPAVGIPVRLKIEDHNNNTRSVEAQVNTTKANTWETLVFDFSNQAAGTAALNTSYTFDMASIFFDFGTVGSGKVFYWDDIKFGGTVITSGIALPLTFESTTLNYAFTDFNGGGATVVNNPFKTGINTSSKVGKMVKSAGEVWGGSFITLDNPIDFSTSKIFKVKVYSPRVGAKLLLKVENLTDGGISFEKEVATTTANGWEELTFDFSTINAAKSYQKVVLIFDLGTIGDGSSNFTFYFDDIKN